MTWRTRLLVMVILAAQAVPAAAQFGPAAIVAAPVVRRDLAPRQTVVGTVKPLRTSTVGSAASGRVERFLVNEGDRVRRGQPLAVLRTRIIEAELATAQAELRARLAELEELQNGTRPEEIQQAEARLAASEAAMQYRRAVQQRTRLLAAGTASSAQELDEAIALANQADAAFLEAKATLKLLQDGPRKEKIAQAQAKAQAQRAEVDRLQEQLERHTIVAPFDGYIISEHTEVGYWLMQGAPVVDIAELDQVEVEIALLEDYVGFVRIGDQVPVEMGAFPGKAFHGRISVIVPQANLKARTFPVKIRLRNPRETRLIPEDPLGSAAALLGSATCPSPATAALWPVLYREKTSVLLKAGMFARVAVPAGPRGPGLVVPSDALVLRGRDRLVYVIDPDAKDNKLGKARPVVVQLGAREGAFVQVMGDLQPGQMVVVQGNERLLPGQDVRIARVQETNDK